MNESSIPFILYPFSLVSFIHSTEDAVDYLIVNLHNQSNSLCASPTSIVDYMNCSCLVHQQLSLHYTIVSPFLLFHADSPLSLQFLHFSPQKHLLAQHSGRYLPRQRASSPRFATFAALHRRAALRPRALHPPMLHAVPPPHVAPLRSRLSRLPAAARSVAHAGDAASESAADSLFVVD